MIILKTRNPYYNSMKRGLCKLTGRAGDSGPKDYWNMVIREVMIQLVDENDSPMIGEKFYATVSKIRKYQSVEDACKELGPENLLPEVKTVEDAVKIYNSFPGYQQRIKNNGFIVIELN